MVTRKYTASSSVGSIQQSMNVEILQDEFFNDRRRVILSVLEQLSNDIRRDMAIEQGAFTVKQWPTTT